MIRQDGWPRQELVSIAIADAEALRVRNDNDWALGAFLATFDRSLDRVLLVQLGDYARSRYDGNPWTLPGGAVAHEETPSIAALRELREETGLAVPAAGLRFAGWFPRPYYKPPRTAHAGELVLLFALAMDTADTTPTPSPPETIGASFVRFEWPGWLSIPTRGTGRHLLQPMPRHWAYWTWVARERLRDPASSPTLWRYTSADAMRHPPQAPIASDTAPSRLP